MEQPEAAEFAQMARQLYGEPDVEQTVEKVADFAKSALACDYAGVMLVHSREQVETAAASDPIVQKADALQVELDEGPCLQSIWSHDWFVIGDTTTDRRWPTWSAGVADFGIRSVLSMRLFVGQLTLGALNLYAATTDRFDADDIAVAGIFAGHASVAVGAARDQSSLREAVDARNLIGQAQGILMERFDVDADQAFSILRRFSQHQNVKLRTVAQQIIDSRKLPD